MNPAAVKTEAKLLTADDLLRLHSEGYSKVISESGFVGFQDFQDNHPNPENP